MNYLENAAATVPTPRQVAWNQMEFYGFVHFGLYTYAPLNEGHNSSQVFNPEKLNPRQWVSAFKSAGMTGLLLTCKHHEGFCLWPSKYTDFSVKQSPWKNGQGDVVKEVSEACREEGLKFGVYLSPWDMYEPTYGTPAYNTYFLNQLEELLTNYGDIFCVWFDGACRAPEKVQPYDWEGYYELIRRLQPNACISICGPDVRWCGNEAGKCRDEEWSVVPKVIMTTERNPGYWRQIDEIPNSTWKDIGSRSFLEKYPEVIWYPAEVDVSIRPGWGYIPGEDKKLLSLKELMHIYESSVGGNATLLLNVPSNPDGLFDEVDVIRLGEMGEEIRRIFKNPLTSGAKALSEDSEKGHEACHALEESREGYWKSKAGMGTPVITFVFPETEKINLVLIKETIEVGQHIAYFYIDACVNGLWETVFEGKTIGYKKLCRFPTKQADAFRIRIAQARGFSALTRVEAFFDEKA